MNAAKIIERIHIYPQQKSANRDTINDLQHELFQPHVAITKKACIIKQLNVCPIMLSHLFPVMM